MRFPLGLLTAAGFCLIVSLNCTAHDTWLLPESAAIGPKSELRLDLTSGMKFPDLDHPINPDRVDKSGCRLAGKTDLKLIAMASDKSLRFDVRLPDPGIATAWVELKPRPIELSEKQVAEYLDEIGASESIRQAWANSKDRRWREIYTKHSKTFIRVGDPGNDGSWADPVGLGLEIVPKKDPTTLHAGDTLPVLVLKNGKPLAGFSLGAECGHTAVGPMRITDKNGLATVELTKSGWWLFRGTDLRSSRQDKTDWESDFATLTIEVQPK